MRKVLLFIIFLSIHLAAYAQSDTIRYVKPRDKGGAYTNDGLTWQTAKDNIQDAINDMRSYMEQYGLHSGNVYVASGRYEPTEAVEGSTNGQLSTSFIIYQGIHVYGGFNADSPEAKPEDRELYRTEGRQRITKKISEIEPGDTTFIRFRMAHTTYLDGNHNPNAETTVRWNPNRKRYDTSFPGNSYHVVYFASRGFINDASHPGYADTLQYKASVDGFTIENGNAVGVTDVRQGGRDHTSMGGGVYMVKNSVVENCIIEKCSAAIRGGGVYMDGGGELINSDVSRCQTIGAGVSGGLGGGVCIDNAGSVRGSWITGNVGRLGGGIAMMSYPENHPRGSSQAYRRGDFDPFVSAVIVSNNTATTEGGGIYLDRGGIVNHATIVRNDNTGRDITYGRTRYGRTGGVFIYGAGQVYNSVIWGNTCSANNDIQYSAVTTGVSIPQYITLRQPLLYYTAMNNMDITNFTGTVRVNVYSFESTNNDPTRAGNFPLFLNPTKGSGCGQGRISLNSWYPFSKTPLQNKAVRLNTQYMPLAFSVSSTADVDFFNRPFYPISTLGAVETGIEDIETAMVAPVNSADCGGSTAAIPTLFVDPNRIIEDPSAKSGASWEEPLDNIAEAIEYFRLNNTTGNTQILVKQGTMTSAGIGAFYAYNSNNPANISLASIRPLPNMKLYGGFPSSNEGTSTSGRNPKDYPTRISGDIINGSYQNNALHVVSFARAHDAVVDGFQLYYGNARRASSIESAAGGGAIIVDNNFFDAQARVSMTNNVVRNCVIANSSGPVGGAVAVNSGYTNASGDTIKASLTLENCVINNCASPINIIQVSGSSSLKMDHCTVIGNVVSQDGSLMATARSYGVDGSIEVTNSAFHGNAIGTSQNKPASVNDIPANSLLPLTSGNNITASNNLTDKAYTQDLSGFSRVFGFESNDTLSYPGFVNPVRDLGVAMNTADNTVYGGAADYTPLDMNPMVNQASASGDHSTWGTDLTTTISRDYGGAPDVGALECHQSSDITSGGQATYGYVIYVRDYNSYDSNGNVTTRDDATTNRDGTSWSRAINGNGSYPYNGSNINGLQLAVNNASATSGSTKPEVWVAEGKYTNKSTDQINGQNYAYSMADGVNVFGGFPKQGNPSMNERNPKSYVSILQPQDEDPTDLNGSLITNNSSSVARVLVQPNDFSTETKWDGFTLRYGFLHCAYQRNIRGDISRINTSNIGSAGGAGAYLMEKGILENCELLRNTILVNPSSSNLKVLDGNDSSTGSGGGYHQAGAGVYITTKTNNGEGGTLRNCVVAYNRLVHKFSRPSNPESAWMYGAGVYQDKGVIYNTIIRNNSMLVIRGDADANRSSNSTNEVLVGAGAFLYSGQFYNNTIVNNTAQSFGSANHSHHILIPGIYVYNSITMYNSVVSDNTSIRGNANDRDGGNTNRFWFDIPVCYFQINGSGNTAQYIPTSTQVEVKYSYIDINRGDSKNLCYANDKTDNTNIYLDYNKATHLSQSYTSDKIYNNSTFRLVSGSPCVNAGTDNIDNVTIPSYDASYAARIQDCTIDIGAYEYNGAQNIIPRVTTQPNPYIDSNGVRRNGQVEQAEYFVNQNGIGDASAANPQNAACATKLQSVLDAAGRYKYSHPRAHVIIRLEALPDSAGYTPTRSAEVIAGETVNPRSYSFIVPMGVEIDGGWPTNGNFGIDASGKLHGKDPINNITRLSGEYVSGTQTVNVYHVVTFTDEVFDIDGKPTGQHISDSVKIYVPNTSAQATDEDLAYKDFDRAKLSGLYIEGGRAEGINEADQNGAAAVVTGYALISDCIVRDNQANGYGGAFYMLPGSVVYGSIIENNKAAYGGAIAVAEGDSTEEEAYWAFLLSNTITRNEATTRGGGLYFTDNARTWNSVYWNNTSAEQNDISGVTDTENEQNILNSPVNFCAITNQNISGNNNINLSPQDENGTRWGTDTNLKRKHDFDYYLPSRASVLSRAGMPYDELRTMIGMMPGIDSLDIAGVSRIQYTREDSIACDTAYDGEKLVVKDNYAIEIGARALNDNFTITFDPQHPMYRLFVAHPENMNANTAQKMMDSNDATYRQEGSSFANPFLRLTDALNYVIDARKSYSNQTRDQRFEIFIAEGTYTSHADMYGRQENVRSHTFVIPEAVSIYGGIDARNAHNMYCQDIKDGDTIKIDSISLIGASTDSIRLKRERFDINQNSIVEPWEMSHATVLSGFTEGSDFQVHNVYHVMVAIGDPNVVGAQPTMTDNDGNTTTDRTKESYASRGKRAIIIDGVTVSDGAAEGYESSVYNHNYYFRGGGIFVSGDDMQNGMNGNAGSDMQTGQRNIPLVISNSLFQNNVARLGGAVFSDGAVHIIGSSFVQNLAESPSASETADLKYVTFSGGGAVATNDALFAVNTIFANNEARDGGGTIEIDNTGATKRANISTAEEVDTTGKSVTVTRNANEIRGYGGMIWAGDHAAVRLINCNSVRNKAHAYASIYNCTPNTAVSGTGHPHFGVNCIFWGNQVDEGQDSLLMNYGLDPIGGLYFSAYQEGKGLAATVTPNEPDSVYQSKIIEGGYEDILKLDSILGHANHNIILSDDNNAIDGPNFTLPSNEAGVSGYLPSADWVPSRINRLCDAGWGSIKQTPDGQFVKEQNIDLDNREAWFINGVYGLMADFYMREFNITLLPQGDEKYMMYANDDGSEGDRNMNRISSDPLGTITRDYIDIGVYEYQHTLLHIANGDQVDELWVSDDETTGNNDGRSIDHPTSDLQRAIQTLLLSRNNHPKVIHIMEGTYTPVYELDGSNYGFQIHNMPTPSTVALPETMPSGHSYRATSITFLGGYSKDIKGQRDVNRYPTVFRMVKRTNSTDANVAHLFYIADAEQWQTSASGNDEGSITRTSVATGTAMPIVFDGITFVNPWANESHKDLDDNGSAVDAPFSGTATGGAAIYYKEQFKTVDKDATIVEGNNDTPEKSTTDHLEVRGNAPKLTIRNCKFEENADSTSQNVPAVFIGKGGGRTVIYNSLFDNNHGSPIVSYDTINIVNSTFASNGGHVTVKTSEAQSSSTLSNSILWETIDKTTDNRQYEGFATDSVRHNAIYGISDGDSNGNVSLSRTNNDPMHGPNFLNASTATGQTRDYSLNPGMQTMDRADTTLYNRFTYIFRKGVSIPDADSSIVILRPDTTMQYDLSWGARYFGNGLDVGAYECRVKQQRVLYVRPSQPTNSTGTDIGSSWENYYGNNQLQTAIDAAAIYASTNRKRAYVLVKGEANSTSVQDAISLRDNVSIYGSIPENFLTSMNEDNEDSEDSVNEYISSMIASRPGIAARSARRSRIAGIRTDDADYSNGALIDGFEVRSTTDPQVPTVYITQPAVLSKLIVDDNRTTNGQPVVDMQQGLLYNSLVYGNVPLHNTGNTEPMMYLGKDAAILNSTIVSDSVGLQALGGEGYLANSITYGLTNSSLTAMTGNTSRASTLVCDSVNTQSGIPFAPYLMAGVNPIKLSSYITDFRPYSFQLHEASRDITGGNDDIDDIIAKAPGDNNSGAKYILTLAKDKGWVNFATNHDILGNRRFFGRHIDRGCFETWYVKADTTETATADNYPHEGSVVYIMERASLNLGNDGDAPIYTSVNPFRPAFLLMLQGASLYGNGNTIQIPYIAAQQSIPKGINYALLSLPFRFRIGDAMQTFFNSRTGQINARLFTGFTASTYDSRKRSAWNYHFDADNSECWVPVDSNTTMEPNMGWLATLPDHDDETVRFVSAAETDGDYVYTESGTPKTVTLIQYDSDTNANGNAHFTKEENMGWNIIGLPYLVSEYRTGVTVDDGNADYPMHVPHVIYTMDQNGKFTTQQSWDGQSTISYGMGVMTQTAIIPNTANNGRETVTFALPHQNTAEPTTSEAKQMIVIGNGDGETDDELQINASPEARALQYTLGSDGVKWLPMNRSLTSIYAVTGSGTPLSLSSATPEETNIPVVVNGQITDNTTIDINDATAFNGISHVWLMDNETGYTVDLKDGPVKLTQSADGQNSATTGSHSFTLRLGDTKPDGSRESGASAVHIYLTGRTLHVDGLRSGDEVGIYTISGQLYIRDHATSSSYTCGLQPGVYVVRAGGKGQAVGVK